jgi:hypothetical protein
MVEANLLHRIQGHDIAIVPAHYTSHPQMITRHLLCASYVHHWHPPSPEGSLAIRR